MRLAQPLESLRDRFLRLLRPLLALTVPALELLVRGPRRVVRLDRVLQLAVCRREIAHVVEAVAGLGRRLQATAPWSEVCKRWG